MRRWILMLWFAAMPLMFTALAGCEQETRVETRNERIEESPKRTVSPGEPIVE